MKKGLMLGIALICGAQMSFAAPKSVEVVRKSVTESFNRAKTGSKEATVARVTSNADILSRISGSDKAELSGALKRSFTVKDVDGNKTIKAIEIADGLIAADQQLRSLDRNTLDAQGKAHLDLAQEAVKVSSEFLSLANRTSDMSATATQQQKIESAAFYKQVSLIQEMLTTMDTIDLKSHVDIMKKAIAARTQPKINGDQAFAAAFKQGKSNEEYLQKLNELISCAK